MTYAWHIRKRRLEDIFILPFVVFGRMKARSTPLKKAYDAFLFFPFHHTGGAEKVHAQIAMALRDKSCLVIFTRRSHDEGFRSLFLAAGHDVIDISAYTDDKLRYWRNLVWRGVASAHINGQAGATVVFNGQCNFAYKCSPWIDPSVPQYELIHSFNSFSLIRIPFLAFYRRTVMISRKAMEDHRRQYADKGMPENAWSRVTYIRNGVQTPDDATARDTAGRALSVLYAGRGTEEKRVHLVARIARACREKGFAADFVLMGDVSAGLAGESMQGLDLRGNVTDPDEVDRTYRQADVLILTSSEEGFPMVVMEAMARGCIILSTPVGELPEHIRAGVSGFLFSSVTDETAIVEEACGHLARLQLEAALCRRMSEHNISYAREHFGMEAFRASYRALLFPENGKV